MKALVVYVVFVAIGAVASSFVGLFAEREVSSGVGLLVFLVLLFADTRGLLDRCHPGHGRVA